MITARYTHKQVGHMLDNIEDWCHDKNAYCNVIDYDDETDTSLEEEDYIYEIEFETDELLVDFSLTFAI